MRKYIKFLTIIIIVITSIATVVSYFAKAPILTFTPVIIPAKSHFSPIAPRSKQDQLNVAILQNPKTIAWLTIPETSIDHPIMQTTNNEFYLNHLPSGEYDPWGCYFADYINDLSSKSSLDANTIIYGHSEFSEDPTDRDFTQLFNYLDINFLTENPYMYLSLKGEDLIFQVSAVFFSDTDFDYINPNPIDNGIVDFYQSVQNKSEYVFSKSINEDDKILTLSTCAYRYDTNNTGNHRLVVMAKLLPKDSLDIPLIVQSNPSPKRPN